MAARANTDRPKCLRLNGTQKLDLIGERQATDLVEEECPSVRLGEISRHVSYCASEGSLRVPKHRRLEQRVRDGAHIQRY